MNTSSKQQSSSSSSNCCFAPQFTAQQQQVRAVTAPTGSSSGRRPVAPSPLPAAARSTEKDGVSSSSSLCPSNLALMGRRCSPPSCCSSSSSCPTFLMAPLQSAFFVLLLLYCSVPLINARLLMGRHHHHHPHYIPQQQLTADDDPSADSTAAEGGVPSAKVVSLLDGELLLAPSSLLKMASDDAENVCGKSNDREATIVRSLSKTTGQPVLLLPQQHFKVAYCEQSTMGSASAAETEQCAAGSNCATVYRWMKALVQAPKSVEQQLLNFSGTELEFADDVLVPMDCLCVLRWAQVFRGKGPIIFG